jgi:uncharacterized protein (TIGR03067 family)
MLVAVTAAGTALGAEKTAEQKSTAKPADIDLSGVWQGYVVDGKGENPNRGNVHLELTVKGNQIVGKRLDGQGGSLGQGTYTITAGQKVWLIDATQTGTRGGKPRVYLGICTFARDTMRWCVSTPGNKRPADFETKGQQFLVIIKRLKQPSATDLKHPPAADIKL